MVNLSRRAVLTSIGAAVGAGCATRSDEGPSSTGTAGETTETDTTRVPDSVDTAWPMPAFESGRSNFTPETAGPTTRITDLWRVSTEAALSDPIVARGRVYVGGDDGVVRALDARSGTARWRESVGARAGIPWALDDRLYVPVDGGIVALEADDGTPAWRAETPRRTGFVAARHGVYYVDTAGPAVVAIDRADGSNRWRSAIDDPWQATLLATDEHVIVSTGSQWDEPWTLAADTGRFAGRQRPDRGGSDMTAERFALDGTVFAIDPMFGELQAATTSGGYDATWHGGVDAYAPVALAGGAEHLYVAGTHPESRLYACSLTDGETEWRTSLPGAPVGRPTVAGESVLVRTEDELRCVDPDDGAERWTRTADGIGSRVVLADDLVYTTDGDEVRAFRAQ